MNLLIFIINEAKLNNIKVLTPMLSEKIYTEKETKILVELIKNINIINK